MTEEPTPTFEASDELAKVVARFPLPEGVPDADLNQAELAGALGVSANQVGKYVKASVEASVWAQADQFPVLEKGGFGKSYVIRYSHARAVLQLRAATEMERSNNARATIEAARAQALGLDLKSQDGLIDPTARKQMAEAELRWMEARRKRRVLVELSEVVELMEDLMKIVREGMDGMPDRLERELDLKPEEVTMCKRVGDDVLKSLAERIERQELSELDAAEVDPAERLLI